MKILWRLLYALLVLLTFVGGVLDIVLIIFEWIIFGKVGVISTYFGNSANKIYNTKI